MTAPQMQRIVQAYSHFKPRVLHHGGCKGADKQAGDLADERGIWVEVHLPTTYTAKALLARNRVIVARCAHLLATPRGYHEVLRSGTWATIRYARQAHKPIWIIFPDGTVKEEVNEAHQAD